MEVKAKAKYLRMSPRKVRLVVDVVRGLTVVNALDQLNHINKKAAKPLAKLISSAIANADHNHEIKEDNLYIKNIKVDEGPTFHRWMPRAQGRATPVRKRTSHIDLVLAEIKESAKKEVKKTKLEAPVKALERPKEDEGVRVKSAKGARKGDVKPDDIKDDKGKEIHDPRQEGKGKHTKIEGGSRKGFSGKIFRRKSG